MEVRKENKLGTMPIGKLLTTMSLPIMASMLIQALYNIVDSIFVAQISENAFTAVSLAYPVQTMMIAVSVGTGVGINSLLSRRLGQKRFDDANATAMNGLFLGVLSWLVFALFGLFFSRRFLLAFTDIQEIVDMGTDYMSIVTIFSFGSFLLITGERIMQATGNSLSHMLVQSVGAIINLILDPIMIFGLFGVPKMGVAGAAWATIIGQIIAMILGMYINIKKNKDIHIDFRKFRPNGHVIKDIYKVGFPSIVVQAISSFMVVGMNKILIPFSTTAVSVMGAYFRIQNFAMMPMFGMGNGFIPIVGYNYGAHRKDRIVHATKLALIAAGIMMIVATVVVQIIPESLLLLFNASEQMLEVGVPALRIISSSFLFAGYTIMLSNLFQAIGRGIFSLYLSLIRQLVTILPMAYIIARFVSLYAVWFAFPLSEIIASIIATLLFRYVYTKVIKPIVPLD